MLTQSHGAARPAAVSRSVSATGKPSRRPARKGAAAHASQMKQNSLAVTGTPEPSILVLTNSRTLFFLPGCSSEM